VNDFGQWRQWAGGLDDLAFSRLWLALGAVAAQPVANIAPAGRIGRVLADVVASGELKWSFPRFDDAASLRLPDVAAQGWIDAWYDAVGDRLARVPLRIIDWPADESPDAWLAELAMVAPVASLRLARAGSRMLDWPLRMAGLGDADRAELAQASGLWPSDRLSRSVGGEGECFACDVLLCRGEFDAVLALLEKRGIGANLLVLCAQRPLAADDFRRLDALLGATQASGYVVIDSTDRFDLPGRINRFVEELSHARRVDVAACLAFQDMSRQLVVALGDDLARFTIRNVADRLQARSRNLQGAPALPAMARGELDAIMRRVPPAASDAQPPATAPGAAGAEPHRRSGGLESMGDEAAEPSGGLEALGGDEEEGGFDDSVPAPASAPAPMPAAEIPLERIPDYERLEAPYDHESGGATTLVEAVDILDRAEAAVSSNRYLQQRSSVLRDGREEKAANGFLVGHVARVRVHIGPPDRESNALAEPFPENALPQELASWDLDVWLSEPGHVKKPLHGRIHLRRTGASDVCVFEFTPQSDEAFNGRLSVLHRGRVIQTAALRASVSAADAIPADASAPALESLIQVRQGVGEPDRRRFDLAFVLNHAGTAQPTAHAMGGERAWMSNLRVVEKTVVALNKVLSTLTRSVQDYAGGLDSEKGRDLLRKLAQIGSYLHLYLVESQKTGAGAAAGTDVLAGEFLQVVSTRSDAIVIPFEFIYAYDAPDDDAALCPQWRDAVKAGRCAQTCQHDAATFCPMGFWGMSKVIERHALQPGLAGDGEVGVQSAGVAGRDTLKISGSAVFGCSDRVDNDDLEPLRQRMATAHMNAGQATDWKDWARLVGASKPSLLIAMAHADGAGFAATIEIGGKPIKTIGITAAHIRASAEAHEKPLVALLGCDMAGTDDDYANPVAVFSTRGAAAVIGTIATVLAEDSAAVAARLMQGLTFADPAATRRLGEAMRDLKRNALLDGELMPLCLVGFGDADWLLSN
jgi:hypothetical protein